MSHDYKEEKRDTSSRAACPCRHRREGNRSEETHSNDWGGIPFFPPSQRRNCEAPQFRRHSLSHIHRTEKYKGERRRDTSGSTFPSPGLFQQLKAYVWCNKAARCNPHRGVQPSLCRAAPWPHHRAFALAWHESKLVRCRQETYKAWSCLIVSSTCTPLSNLASPAKQKLWLP